MIGLQRGTVLVVPHQADWHELFEQERHLLHQHIGHLVLDLQHVGSTAVPGLDAKPIIDLAAAVASVGVTPQCRQPLGELGYLDRGDAGRDGGYLFVKEAAPEVRTHHLHLVAINNPEWRTYLQFRDMLRADETLRARYGELKNLLQKRFAQDRRGYTNAKQEFIRDILAGRRPSCRTRW